MDYTVTYSKSALAELENMVGLMSREDALAAQKFAYRLLDRANSLRTFPFRHPAYAGQTHLRKLPMAPYLIYYRINESKRRVTILHFWHGSRQSPRL